MAVDVPLRQIRAVFDETSITVYQAYASPIALAAVKAGRFVSPFSIDRFTWIKPSFLWMMYRSGWATKPGQEHVLAVRIFREGFEWALEHSCLSHFDAGVYADYQAWQEAKESTPVRIQWDPERSPSLEPLPWRSIQIGLGREAARRYVDDWTIDITDITPTVRALQEQVIDTRLRREPASSLVRPSRLSGVEERSDEHSPALLPVERPYPLPTSLARTIGAIAN